MATHRGRAFLDDQFRSIVEQTRPPDEMVICDDRSEDGTIDAAYEFAAKAPFPVLVTQNADRTGTNGAFEHALRLARGDLIALADQDDVWEPGKLARLERALLEHPEALLAFSDVTTIDAAGAQLGPFGENPWRQDRATREVLNGPALELLMGRPQACGMSMLFRRAVLDRALPFSPGGRPSQSFVEAPLLHDRWIGLAAASAGPLVYVNEDLVRFRRHPTQRSAPGVGQFDSLQAENPRPLPGKSSRSLLPRRVGEGVLLALAPLLENTCARLRELDNEAVTRLPLQMAEERLELIRLRLSLPDARAKRIGPIWRLLRRGVYRRHSRGAYSALADAIGWR
jgi:hypothetical protein